MKASRIISEDYRLTKLIGAKTGLAFSLTGCQHKNTFYIIGPSFGTDNKKLCSIFVNEKELTFSLKVSHLLIP
jgi:hypothetical protein